jgi:glycosyltransferase involved in cell wall biosynthesis
MEGMAKGLAVIATDVSGTGEELGETGKLLPNPIDDPEGTVNGLVSTLELWASDPNLRSIIGQACKQRAERLFSHKRMVKEYLELIQVLLL